MVMRFTHLALNFMFTFYTLRQSLENKKNFFKSCMKADSKAIWILKGYEIFATSGQSALKVEPLANMVGKSKSSFYHHFADLELFIAELLKYHINQSKVIAEKEQHANNIDPDLINILTEHALDLLFNRQLRIYQNNKIFADTLMESNKIVGDAFVNVWVKDLSLQLTQKQMEALFSLALENFYLQINTHNLHHKWLSAYFINLKNVIRNFVD